MSDRTRIQRALERGDVRAHEWASLPTPDGIEKPILRVGARIEELRRQGVNILTVEKRPSALYRLQSSPASPSHARDGVTAGGAKLGAEPLPPLGSAPEHATKPLGPAEEHARLGIADGIAGLHPERAGIEINGPSPYADDDDLGWIADRYDDGKAAA